MGRDLRSWRARLEPLLDVAIAAAVLLLSLFPLLKARNSCCIDAPTWGFVLVVAQAVLLVWRRRWPLTISLLSGALTLVYGLSSLPDSPVPYAGLVAIYSVAACSTPLLSRAAAVIAAVSIAVAMVIDWPEADVQDITVNYLVFATAWLLGENVRTRGERAAQMEQRAAQAERSRVAEAERAVVEERNRIAREMHDIVAHHVSLMVVQAEAGPVVVDRDPHRAVEVFDSISSTGKQALEEMRRLLGVLRADEAGPREPQPGVAQIPQLVEGVRDAGLTIDLDITGADRSLPAAVDLSAYRVVQEGLTNISRHAGAARVRVRVHVDDRTVRVHVDDDGAGAAPPPTPGGHGLLAMRERVALVGGHVVAGPRPDGGWAIAAELPYADAPGRRVTAGTEAST